MGNKNRKRCFSCRWRRKAVRRADKKQPENLDLIKAYYDWYQKGYRIDLRKVKGHSDNKWNQMADELATGKIRGMNNNEWKESLYRR